MTKQIAEVKYEHESIEIETIEGNRIKYQGGFREGAFVPIESWQKLMGADSVRVFETDDKIIVEYRGPSEKGHYGDYTKPCIDTYFKSQIVKISKK